MQTMSISARFAAVAAIIITTFAATTGCKKDICVTEPEEPEYTFTYGQDTYVIRSVVRLEKDETIEYWMSQTEGLTKVSEIENDSDRLMLSIAKSRLNSGEYDVTETGNSISFYKYSYVGGINSGKARFSVAENDGILTISFKLESLYDSSSNKYSGISGSYTGIYSEDSDMILDGEWALNRSRKDIVSVKWTRCEDGAPSTFTLYDAGGEAVVFNMNEDYINSDGVSFKVNEVRNYGWLSVKYTKKLNIFTLDNNSYGHIKAYLSKDGMIVVSISLTNGTRSLRAEYTGAYESELTNKGNRHIFTYKGTHSHTPCNQTGGQCRNDIAKLIVRQHGTSVSFWFPPTDGYSSSSSMTPTQMPILTVPESFIGKGKVMLAEEDGWKFEFDAMQVEPYESEEKPYPSAASWVRIEKADDSAYEVEIELTCPSTQYFLYEASIDLHYKGRFEL